MTCLALLCVPAVSVAAGPGASPAKAHDSTDVLLAPGAGYGQPHGAREVRALQRRLSALGERPGPIDGYYGTLTRAAVERLQRDTGVSVDGVVGPETRRVLKAESPPLAPGAGYGDSGGSRQVRTAQRRLRALGHRPGPIDGRYGPRTQAAVARFQRAAGQPASGVLSRRTAMALASADSDEPVRASSDTGSRRETRPRGREARPEVQATVDRPTAAAGTGNPTSPILLLALGLALATSCGLVAAWLKRRGPGPQTRGMPDIAPRASRAANARRRGRAERSDAAALKVRIRNMRASGMALQAIADRLNAEGVPTLRGGAKWRPSGVQAAAGYRSAGNPVPTATGTAAAHGNGAGDAPPRTPAPLGERGARSETWLPATSASSGEARSLVRAAAAETGLDGAPAWDLMLASTEAVNNAVQHGRAWPNGCIRFTTEPCDRGLRVEVCNLGKFDSALEPAALDATSGRGMQIIAALVDRLEVKNGDGRTLVRFEKHRPRVPSEDETTNARASYAVEA